MSTIVRKPQNTRKSWVVRYQVNGKQHERGFATRPLARDFQIKLDHDQREQTFADPRAGRELFGPAAEAYLARLAIVERTRATYTEVWSKHLAPALAHRTLSQVSQDRDGAVRLLTSGPLGGLSISPRRAARMIITGVLDEAVKAGKITAHRCGNIELIDNSPRNGHDGFIFPSHGQVAQVAEAAGVAVWLMRGCGLRISEAMAVERGDFRDGGTVLRVSGQASRDGRAKLPLKHRRAGEYRDIPVPSWLWQMVAPLPDGPLMPGRDRPYKPYRTALNAFTTAAGKAGIGDGFHPHSLRHAFASALLGAGVPISDVATWLGHRNIQVTFAIYSHLISSASARAVAALDAEYAGWAAA